MEYTYYEYISNGRRTGCTRYGCKLIDHWMIDTLDVNEDVDLNEPELARVCVFHYLDQGLKSTI